MPGSLQSYRSFEHGDGQHEGHDDDNDYEDIPSSRPPRSPIFRRSQSYRTVDERSSLLENPDHRRTYQSRRSSRPGTPRTVAGHGGSMRIHKNHSRSGSQGLGFQSRLVGALDRSRNNQPDQCKSFGEFPLDSSFYSSA